MRFKSPLEGALYLSLKGFKVFPLRPNSKEPAFRDWQKWAESATERKVQEYGTANKSHNWGVYAGASDLTIVDIDVKHGIDGFENYKRLVKENQQEHNPTFTVRTPTGGWHLYYSNATKTCKLYEGVDIRSKGAYVVAPGSIIDDVEYEVYDNAPKSVSYNPKWIEHMVRDKGATPEPVKDVILDGERNTNFISVAGSMRRRGLNYDEILAALVELNKRTVPPLSDQEIRNITKTASKYKVEEVDAALAFEDTPLATLDKVRNMGYLNLDAIPKRNWIALNRFIGGFASSIIAPGGLGKSTLTINDAISVALGESFNGAKIIRQGNVWMHNTEDPMEETERRVGAFCLANSIPFERLTDKLFTSSSKETPFIIAKTTKEGVVINKRLIKETIQFIRDNNIILFFIDPFVRCHQCNENNNMEIDVVIQTFNKIIDATGCAICFVHHTSKSGALHNSQTNDPSMYSARGASALINAVRLSHVLSPMNEDEARRFNIPDTRRKYYIRLDTAKSNLQPPAEFANWFEKVSTSLPNGDSVGTVKKIDMQEVAKNTLQPMEINEKQIVARFLNSILIPDDPGKNKIAVSDVIEAMNYDDETSKIFAFSRKTQSQAKLMGMLKETEGMMFKDKVFVYHFDPHKTSKKHLIIAKKKNEKEGLDLGSPALEESLEFLS